MKSLAEIEDRWTVRDLLDANMAIDIWDDLESKARKKAAAKARAAAASR